MKMNRKFTFSLVLFVGMMIDMLSTYFLVQSGYRETTGLILMFINAGDLLLFGWAVLVSGTFYVLYPYFEKFRITIHIETIVLYFAIISVLAGVGNIYLYYNTSIAVISLSGVNR